MPNRIIKRYRRDRTEISCFLKYSIFSVNVVCWVRMINTNDFFEGKQVEFSF